MASTIPCTRPRRTRLARSATGAHPFARLVLLACLVVACERVDSDTELRWPITVGQPVTTIVHPEPSAMLSTRHAGVITVPKSTEAPNIAIRFEALTVFDTTRAVGMLSGSPDFVFGNIVDAFVDSVGNLFLLDDHYGMVRMLPAQTEPVRMFGSFGDGPGEFREPVSLVSGGPDWLGVLDRAGGRVEKYALTDSIQPAGRTTIAVPMPADACSTTDRLIALGTLQLVETDSGSTAVSHDDGYIHILDDQGHAERSFSVPYYIAADDPREMTVLAHYFGQGHIACNDRGIWAAYSWLGEVHAFSSSGDIQWIAKISGFDHPRVVQGVFADGNSGFVRDSRGQAFEIISGLTLMAPRCFKWVTAAAACRR